MGNGVVCDVPCKAVKEDLDDMWKSIGRKVSFIVFFSVLGGLLIIAVFFGEAMTSRQSTTLQVVMDIQKSVAGIKGELKHLNGRERVSR